MRISSSTFIATALVSVAACSNVECFENEEKVGNTCYPVRSTVTADAAAATASDGGPSGDSGAGVSKLDGSVTLDGGVAQDASGANDVPPVPSGPAADAAPGSAAPEGERDSGTATVPPKATEEGDAAAVAAPDAATTAAPDAGPPPKCDGGPINLCGGCDVLAHQPDEPCSDGGVGSCAQPGDANTWYRDCDGGLWQP